jgi:L-serine/L-threonine ammonia-lyase
MGCGLKPQLSSPRHFRNWQDGKGIRFQDTVANESSRIVLKLEFLQPSGSFKSRGIGNFLLSHLPGSSASNSSVSTPFASSESISSGPVHFYSSSGGNAGLACVTAAVALSCPCTVVVPVTTKPLMIAKLREAGAYNVIQTGATWADADRHLKEILLSKDVTGVYVPPFDHTDVWAGNSTIVPELMEQFGKKTSFGGEEMIPAAIICSVGGGGLLCGIKEGLEKAPKSWQDVNVIAVETFGAESLYSAVKAKELVTLPGITSQATSLGAVRVAEQTFRYATGNGANPVKCARVTDEQAAAACVKIADTERTIVELACGASVAAAVDRNILTEALGREVEPHDVVVIVLCGGSNVTVEMLADWRKAALVQA